MIVNYSNLINQNEKYLLKNYSILDLSYRYNKAIKQSFLIYQGIDLEKEEEENEKNKESFTRSKTGNTEAYKKEDSFIESEILKMDENFIKAYENIKKGV